MCPHKQRELWTQTPGRRPRDHRGRGWSDAAARPGTPGVTPRAGRGGKDAPDGLPVGGSARHQSSDPRAAGLWGRSLTAARSVALCRGTQHASPPSQVVVTPHVPSGSPTAHVCRCCSVAKLYPTLCDPVDCSTPGFSEPSVNPVSSPRRHLEPARCLCPCYDPGARLSSLTCVIQVS